jgi:hypothetical protein
VLPTAYIETTVISYLTAKPSREVIIAGHQAVTTEWWENDLPKFRAVISPIVLDEISAGDPEAVAKRLAAIEGMPQLEFALEARSLAIRYFETIHLPDSARADALHLALSTWHGTDYLVTWNCRHIANGRVRKLLQEINDSIGIATPVICTPEELLEFQND